MSNDILNAMKISAMGMKAQGARLRVATENVANAETAGTNPNEEPYRRKIITFKNELDRSMGVDLVEVDKITVDRATDFPIKYMPGHPAADKDGYVRLPNINPLVEIMNVREAQRSYEANLGMIEQAKSMLARTIDLLRA
jgi:flagellar basal-body rod protein FlgC